MESRQDVVRCEYGSGNLHSLLEDIELTKGEKSLINFLVHNYHPSAWLGHLEFAIRLVKYYKPQVIVELGVDYGQTFR